MDDVMIPSSKTTFSYNSNGQNIQESNFTWEDDEWVEKQKILFSYINESLIEEITYDYDSQFDTVFPESKISYTWDYNQLPMEEISYTWELYYWKPEYKSVYFYNGQSPISNVNSCNTQKRNYYFSTNCPSRLTNTELDDHIIIFPNPVNENVYIQFSDLPVNEDLQIVLINTAGETLYTRKHSGMSNQQLVLDLSSYPAGIYIIEIIGNTDISTSKLIKQ